MEGKKAKVSTVGNTFKDLAEEVVIKPGGKVPLSSPPHGIMVG